MNGKIFFDTYAFFEIISGNPSYEQYKDADALTTVFNLAELNYGLKKEIGHDTSDTLTQMFSSYLVEVRAADIQNAMTLKTKKRELSISDAIGYTIAKRLNVPFLTGDGDFKDMPGVILLK